MKPIMTQTIRVTVYTIIPVIIVVVIIFLV